MTLMNYAVDGSVAVITLTSGENRFNPDFITAYLSMMDEIEARPDVKSLVVTSGHEKIFCNGIDLDWLVPIIQKGDTDSAKQFFYLINQLFRRTLTFPMVTVAAINGHAFAGGAIWACAFDFRFMRTRRGFFCVPEVDLGIPFLPGMLALLQKAIPSRIFHEMHHLGKRLTAEECEKHHLVTRALPVESLMTEVLGFLRPVDKKRPVLKEMKARLYRDILHAMDVEDIPFIESGVFHIGAIQ